MAGPDPLYDSVFQQCGVIRARNVTELFDFCAALGNLPGTSGRRVVIQTNSGGPGAAAADACGRAGFHLPPLSTDTLRKLVRVRPPHGQRRQSRGLTFTKDPRHFFAEIPEVLLQDEGTDFLLMYLLMPSPNIRRALRQMGVPDERVEEKTAQVLAATAQKFKQLTKTHPKPVVGYTYRSPEDPFVRLMIENGLTVYPEPEGGPSHGCLGPIYRVQNEVEPEGGLITVLKIPPATHAGVDPVRPGNPSRDEHAFSLRARIS